LVSAPTLESRLVPDVVSTPVSIVAEQFKVTTNLYLKALGGVSREQLLRRPGERSNPLLWIAGHLTLSRVRVVNVLGGAREPQWPELFATGSKVHDVSHYPDVGEVTTLWRDLADEIQQRLRAFPADRWEAPVQIRIPSDDGTMRGALALITFHEAYHVGQMGYVRKWLGLSPLIDG
jgi:hypothetical protein